MSFFQRSNNLSICFMKFKLIFCLVFSLLIVKTSAQTQSVYEKTTDSLFQTGQQEKIILYLEKEVKKHPKSDTLLRLMGSYYLQKKNFELGEKYYREALVVNPACARCYMNIGRISASKRDFSQALADLDKAVNMAPGDALIISNRAKIKEYTGDLSGALSDYNKAIKLAIGNTDNYLERGLIYSRLNQKENALQDYSQAIKLNPVDISAYLNRAEVYYELENLDASCKDYGTAKALLQKGKIDNPALTKAIEASIIDFCDVNSASYYYQRGIAYYNLKQYDKALKMYTLGLEKFPKNAMILSFKGNTCLALRDYKNALLNYALSLENKGNLSAEIQNNHRFASTANRIDAQAFYKATIAAVYYNIAECQIYLEDFNEALIKMNEALAVAPNKINFNKETYFNRRGVIYLGLNHYDLALSDFNRSIEINKNYAPAYVNRALARVSITEKVKKTSFSLVSNLPDQPFHLHWQPKKKTLSQKENLNIISALSDCNTAIALDKNQGSFYYVRGLVKQISGENDYCIDLLMAKKMGFLIEESLLKTCNKK
ncbi:tetratricopeptide (TPR) repeat protein [Pedobacter sp. UYP1]